MDIFTPQAVSSQRSAESTVPALMKLDSMSCRRKTSGRVRVDHRVIPSTGQRVPCVRSFTSTGRSVRSDESVASVERSVFRTQVDQDQSSVERSNLREILERKAEIANQAAKEARRRLSDAEAHLDSRDWERRKSELVLYESQQQLESQKGESPQASQWADQAQRERVNLCGELEMRKRIRYENQVSTNQDSEELRRICSEEENQVRRLQFEELSVRQEKDLNTVSELLKQIREMQDQMNSLVEDKEFHDPDTASS